MPERASMFTRAWPLTICVLCVAASAGAQTRLPQPPPEPPLVLFNLEKYFAGMVQTTDGRLKAFFRSQEGGLASVTFSGDGRTLSQPVVEGAAGQTPEKGVPNLMTANGELHILQAFLRLKAQRPGGPKGIAITRLIDLWHDRTLAGRSKWEGLKMIWEGYCGALMDWKQLKSGRILVPFGSWVPGRDTTSPTGAHVTTAVYSDDSGDTWAQSSSEITSPCYPGYNGNNYGACEPSVIELNDGRIWMLFRTQTGFMFESYSQDNGTTWSGGQPSRFYSSTSPSDFDRLPDGRLVVVWNNYEMPPRVDGQFEYGGRDALHAAISDDDGKTWRGFREIYRDPQRHAPDRVTGDRGTAYPLAYHTDSGTIVVVSGQGPGRRNIIVIDPAWLAMTSQTEDFSSGLDGWLTFKTVGPARGAGPQRKRIQGPQLIAHPSRPGAKVLHLRRPDNDAGDGASWNFPLGRKGRLTLRLMVQPGSGSFNIALGDRCFNPTDDNGEKYAQFNLAVRGGGQLVDGPRLQSGRWHNLELAWDLAQRLCNVSLDGGRALQLKQNFESPNGVCYLRLRSMSARPDPAGLFVESVAVKIDEPVTLPRKPEEIRALFDKYRSTISYESKSEIKVDVM